MKNYLDTIKALLASNKTTGTNHSEAMLHYTQMNVKRLERWMSKGELSAETITTIKAISQPQKWVVITEAWCGDAAHSIGFISKMAASNPLISFEWKWRDENLELMDQFLTNGGRSIPKLIVYNEKDEVLFDWGPRPQTIQTAYLQMKAENKPYEEISIELQKMYNADKGVSIQSEILAKLISQA
jgi:hypothetical protein